MVKRITKEWLAEGAHPALDYVFEHIGVTWPIDEREALFKIASYTAFPPNARMDAWRGYDMTVLTAKNEFYYPITASLNTSPKVWFKNLRLLQLRKKLNLILSQGEPDSSTYARWWSPRKVEGTRRSSWEIYDVPSFCCPNATTLFNDRSDACGRH